MREWKERHPKQCRDCFMATTGNRWVHCEPCSYLLPEYIKLSVDRTKARWNGLKPCESLRINIHNWRLHQCAVGCRACLTRVKLLGDAAHLFTVVSGHSWTTSLVLSSTLITDSLVIPRSRGTSLFLLFIFSCKSNNNNKILILPNFTSWHCHRAQNIQINKHWIKLEYILKGPSLN